MTKQKLVFLAVMSAVIIFKSCSTGSSSKYALSVEIIPAETGTVSPPGGAFETGEAVTLSAMPNNGWRFVRWEGDINSTDNPVNVIMNSNMGISAIFEKRNYPLFITIEGEGYVNEKIIQPKTSEYPFKTIVELTPVPSPGWRFMEWGGDLAGSDIPLLVSITDEKNISATFEKTDGSVLTFGGSNVDWGYSIIQTNDDGFVLTGYTSSNDGDFSGMHIGSDDIFVIKLNSTGQIEWKRTFGDTELDQGYSVTETKDGGIVITGKIYTGRWTTIIIKLDQSGNVLWEKTFYMGTGYSVAATADGGVIVTGYSSSNEGVFEGLNRGETDIFVMKLDQAGNIEWVNTYGGSSGEVGRSVRPTKDGGYLVAGYAYSSDGDFSGLKESGPMALFNMKLDESGNILWVKMYNAAENYSVMSESPLVTETIDGLYFFSYADCKAGETLGSTICHFYVVQVNFSGETVWKKTIQGSENDHAFAIAPTDDGGIVLTGRTRSNDGHFSGMHIGSDDIIVLKMTAAGEIQWINVFGGSHTEGGFDIVQTRDGGYALTGYTGSSDGDFHGMLKGTIDMFFMKLDQHGNF